MFKLEIRLQVLVEISNLNWRLLERPCLDWGLPKLLRSRVEEFTNLEFIGSRGDVDACIVGPISDAFSTIIGKNDLVRFCFGSG